VDLLQRRNAAVLALLALAVLAHAPLRHADYVQDDRLAVEWNPIVARGDVGEIFSSSYWEHAAGNDATLYRPLVILSFAVERAIVGGPSARVAHAVNVGLHAAATLVLLALLLRIGIGAPAAWLAAAVFAVHPVHVEAVANVVGRAEILAAGFTFGALWLLSHAGPWAALEDPSTTRLEVTSGGPIASRIAAWAGASALLLALLSKEVAVAAPILVLALGWLFRPRASGLLAGRTVGANRGRAVWIERAAALAPTALACLAFVVLRVHALEAWAPIGDIDVFDNPLVAEDGLPRTATALALAARVASLLAFPAKLTADYAGAVIPIETTLVGWRPLAGAAFLAVLAAIGLTGRRAPRAAFGAWMFLAPYLVVGNLLRPIGTIFAERVLYLPSAGVCLLLAVFVSWAVRTVAPSDRAGARRRIRATAIGVASIAIVGVLGARTWMRCQDWRSDETLFRAAVESYPRSARAHLVLGLTAEARGDLERALAAFDRSREAWPAQHRTLLHRGLVLGRLGRFAEAERSLRESLDVRPTNAEARFGLGLALRRQGDAEGALRAQRHALVLDPSHARAAAETGHLLLEMGRHADAAVAYERAIALGRTDLGVPLEHARRGAGHAP
jgi:tetratricopeptide (TPR) repeat protein